MFNEFIFLLIFTSPRGKTIDFLFIAERFSVKDLFNVGEVNRF